MKILYTVFITLFSLNASAQFFTKIFPHKRAQTPLSAVSICLKPSPATLIYNASFTTFKLDLGRSRYSINTEEAFIMKKLKHSARYGQTAMRIEFDNLAAFYLNHNRFSEAKWYQLRSNAISRNQRNYGQIIGSLLVLAQIKADLGDYKQADEDLTEAKTIAVLHTLTPDLLLIDHYANQIKLHKETGLKIQNQYSDLL
ncbi:MAG: hypothetical protein EOP42_28455 [Sphingobacteriaceae bacterium]|nr:MAG: hypothetical protein EOP42_28455 [Sphingobacteriaceae bacterium]